MMKFNVAKTTIRILVAAILTVAVATAHAQEAVDLAWDWAPGDSGYTSGPDGDIAHAIYLRTTDDSDYAYDFPVISGIDNCTWDVDHYNCETTL